MLAAYLPRPIGLILFEPPDATPLPQLEPSCNSAGRPLSFPAGMSRRFQQPTPTSSKPTISNTTQSTAVAPHIPTGRELESFHETPSTSPKSDQLVPPSRAHETVPPQAPRRSGRSPDPSLGRRGHGGFPDARRGGGGCRSRHRHSILIPLSPQQAKNDTVSILMQKPLLFPHRGERWSRL